MQAIFRYLLSSAVVSHPPLPPPLTQPARPPARPACLSAAALSARFRANFSARILPLGSTLAWRYTLFLEIWFVSWLSVSFLLAAAISQRIPPRCAARKRLACPVFRTNSPLLTLILFVRGRPTSLVSLSENSDNRKQLCHWMASILLSLFLIKAINAWYRHRLATLSFHDIDIDLQLYHGTDIYLIRNILPFCRLKCWTFLGLLMAILLDTGDIQVWVPHHWWWIQLKCTDFSSCYCSCVILRPN